MGPPIKPEDDVFSSPHHSQEKQNGSPGRIRTSDQPVNSLLLQYISGQHRATFIPVVREKALQYAPQGPTLGDMGKHGKASGFVAPLLPWL